MNDLEQLRNELAGHLIAHPYRYWSPALLRTVIGAMDLAVADCPGRPALKKGERVYLRLATK